MRILFYNHDGAVSGAERSLLAIAERARDVGHTVVLCAPAGPVAREAMRLGITVAPVAPLVLGHTRDPRLFAGYLTHAVAPVRDVARAIRSHRPDVVHANSIKAGLVASLAVRLVRPRPKLVVHVRDALRNVLFDRLAVAVIRHEANAIIAISRYVALRSVALSGRVHVLHNAIDPCRYRGDEDGGQAFRRSFAIPAGTPLLAVAAQLSPWKGQMDALEAFARLRASHPDAHLLVAGAVKFVGKHRRYDNAAYHAALVARAAQPDLCGYVHLVGKVADVTALYSAATLLVVPSWAEPFGRVVIEAMAAGTPVLTTRVGGPAEIITHGLDGWLVPPRDPVALGAAMGHLLDDDALRAALSRRGHITVGERFSLPSYMEALEEVWMEVCPAVPPAARPHSWRTIVASRALKRSLSNVMACVRTNVGV